MAAGCSSEISRLGYKGFQSCMGNFSEIVITMLLLLVVVEYVSDLKTNLECFVFSERNNEEQCVQSSH